MDITTATTRLRAMTAADVEPELADTEVTALLATFATADRYGSRPTDPRWEGTWDLHGAAAEGLRWKAAKASAQFAFTAGGDSFHREQVAAALLELADRYEAKRGGTANTGPFADYIAGEQHTDVYGNPAYYGASGAGLLA